MDPLRQQCTNPGCTNMILAATAARTGGICRPCEHELWRKEDEERIRRDRVDVDPFAGVDDPVRILDILYEPVVHDELINRLPWKGNVEQLVTNLPASQIAEVIERALTHLTAGDEDRAEALARLLAAFTTADLAPLQRAWIAHDSYHPGILFRGAGADVRDALLSRIDDHSNRNHILDALAWIGDDAVVARFASWRSNPPAWRSALYVPPEQYAHNAGWELDASGRRRNLAAGAALPLVPARKAAPPVYAMEPSTARCPWCTTPLTRLFRIDARDPRLSFLGIDWDALELTTCTWCVSFEGPLFMKLDANGTSTWHPANHRADGPSTPPPDEPSAPLRTLAAAAETRGRFRAADLFLRVTFTQLGGLPAWIQDTEYLRCPDCAQTMPFLAQLAHDEVQEDTEGMFYAFYCGECAVTGTVYQQT